MTERGRQESLPRARETEAASLEEAQARIEQLELALRSRVVIEQAKGVLRERFGWSVDDAFEILRYAARSSQTRIHELAASVVASDVTPQPVTVALARSTRWRAAQMRERAEAQRKHAEQLARRVRAQQELLAWDEADRGRRGRNRRSG